MKIRVRISGTDKACSTLLWRLGVNRSIAVIRVLVRKGVGIVDKVSLLSIILSKKIRTSPWLVLESS
jgi:hypothetical protein